MQKILLIDDDKDDRSFFQDAANAVSESIEIMALENCFTLIKDLENNLIPQPELIIIDINMPEKDGWACLKELKDHSVYRNIPVIMYSTTNPEQGAEQAKNAGALSFFTKPYDFRELKETVKEIADHLENGTLIELPKLSKRFF
nr:response regulator [uncultured Flavobacterium sp.]